MTVVPEFNVRVTGRYIVAEVWPAIAVVVGTVVAQAPLLKMQVLSPGKVATSEQQEGEEQPYF